MKEEVKQIADIYLNAFDAFPCDDEKIKADIEAFKKSVVELGEKSDITNFTTRFLNDGYNKTYMDLFGRITLANSAKYQEKEPEKKPRITPKEYAEQYREGYQAVCACKYLPKTEAVYRRIFELGDTCSDVIDLINACEKEDLFIRLSTVNAVERFEIYLSAADPLHKILATPMLNNLKAWSSALSDAELEHNTRAADITNMQHIQREKQIEYLVVEIAATALFYVKAKLQARHYFKEETARNGLTGVIATRRKLKRLVNILPSFGLNWEKICNDKFYRHLLLQPDNLDETARFTICVKPCNVEAINEIIDEAFSDKTESELIFARETHFLNVKDSSDSTAKRYEQIANEADSQLDYFKYKVNCTNI